MVARLEFVLDCTDPDRAAAFWQAALGYELRGEAANYRALTPPAGASGPPLILQGVSEAKTAKNRMHLDIETDDVDGEVARLLQLGARRLTQSTISEHGHHWVVMADPDDNEFCVCGPGPGSGAPA